MGRGGVGRVVMHPGAGLQGSMAEVWRKYIEYSLALLALLIIMSPWTLPWARNYTRVPDADVALSTISSAGTKASRPISSAVVGALPLDFFSTLVAESYFSPFASRYPFEE